MFFAVHLGFVCGSVDLRVEMLLKEFWGEKISNYLIFFFLDKTKYLFIGLIPSRIITFRKIVTYLLWSRSSDIISGFLSVKEGKTLCALGVFCRQTSLFSLISFQMSEKSFVLLAAPWAICSSGRFLFCFFFSNKTQNNHQERNPTNQQTMQLLFW